MKERLTYIGIVMALSVVIAFMARDCSSKKRQINESQQNIAALLDSTRQTRNKIGNLQFERTIFMGDIETLKKINLGLMKEVELQKGKVRVVADVRTKLSFDTIYIDNRVSKIDDSTFVVNFDYLKSFDESNTMGFKGFVPTKIGSTDQGYYVSSMQTQIRDMDIRMKITTGIKDENGRYTIFAKTDFPGVKFDLNGAVIDPDESFAKKKAGIFSLTAGAGMGYGLTQSGAALIPSVGLYVGINLFNF